MKRNYSDLNPSPDNTPSEGHSSPSFDEISAIDLEEQAIIQSAMEHTGNPGRLTKLLLQNFINPKAFKGAIETLEQFSRVPEHNIRAIKNALEKIQEINRQKLIEEQASLIMEQIEPFKSQAPITDVQSETLYRTLLDSTSSEGKPYKPDAFNSIIKFFDNS